MQAGCYDLKVEFIERENQKERDAFGQANIKAENKINDLVHEKEEYQDYNWIRKLFKGFKTKTGFSNK